MRDSNLDGFLDGMYGHSHHSSYDQEGYDRGYSEAQDVKQMERIANKVMDAWERR